MPRVSLDRIAMTDLAALFELGLMIVAAAVVSHLLRGLRIPTIVAYLVTGLVLGPVLGVLGVSEHHDDPVTLIGELGIALLLFLVGLELSLDRLRDVGRVAVVAGLGQVVFTAGFGFVLCRLLGFDGMASLFIATALTFSSTVVVVKLLDEKQELHALYGRIAVGIFLVQDLVAIAALTILAGLAQPEELTVGAVAVSLGGSLLGAVVLLVTALVASRFVLPAPFRWAARSGEMLLVWSLGWCFLFVAAADALGLSPEIGAFLAGLSLAQLRVAHPLQRRVHPLMSFFIAVFFVSLGAQMDIAAAAEHWLAGVVLSLFVLLGNPFVFLLIITRAGYDERTAFKTSVTVAQISEFSFILAAVGMGAGFIDEATLALIAGVGFATIVGSSYMILYSDGLYRWCRDRGLLRPFRAHQVEEAPEAPPLDGHVVVVGMNALGRALVEALHARGETVLAVDTDPAKLVGLPARALVGDVEEHAVIDEIHLKHARLAISALQIEDVNRLFAWRCRRLGVPVVIHAFDQAVLPELQALEVDLPLDAKRAAFTQIDEVLRQLGVVAS